MRELVVEQAGDVVDEDRNEGETAPEIDSIGKAWHGLATTLLALNTLSASANHRTARPDHDRVRQPLAARDAANSAGRAERLPAG